MTGNEMIHGCAQTINIGSGVCLTVTTVLFGSSIASGTETRRILYACRLEFSRCTEVNQRDVSVGLEHYVSGLHIAIDDRRFSGVEITEHIAKLL